LGEELTNLSAEQAIEIKDHAGSLYSLCKIHPPIRLMT